MSKFKVLERQGQIGIRCKLSSGESINSNEVLFFSNHFIRGIMQPTVEDASRLVYVGAQGVQLSGFLRQLITKDHFFMIAAQIVEIYKTGKVNGLDPNWFVLDPDNIIINSNTGEMYFIHSAVVTNQAVNGGFLACINQIANAASFVTIEDYNAVGEFLGFVNGIGYFAVNAVDNYIKEKAPGIYSSIPHIEYNEPDTPPAPASQYAAPAPEYAAPAAEYAAPAMEAPAPAAEYAAPAMEAPAPAAEYAAPAMEAPAPAAEYAPPAMEAPAPAAEYAPPVMEAPAPAPESVPPLMDTPAMAAPAAEVTAPVPEAPAPVPAPEPVYTAKLVRRSTGETIAISKPVFRLGKERAKVDYCITDNNTVSRVHATIYVRNGECYISDNNSTNRTFINGSPVPVQAEIPLKDGDIIKLSNVEFDFIG